MFCFVNDYSEGAREHMLQRLLQQKSCGKGYTNPCASLPNDSSFFWRTGKAQPVLPRQL